MFSQFLIHLAGFGLLLCPLVCAGGLSPCCAADGPVEESACCCHDTDGEPAPCPSEDDDDRECIASRADLGSVSRPSETLSRSLDGPPESLDVDSSKPMIHGPSGMVEDSALPVSTVPVRTLNCALLL